MEHAIADVVAPENPTPTSTPAPWQNPRTVLEQALKHPVSDEEALADVGIRAIVAAFEESERLGHPVTIRTQISPVTGRWLLGVNFDNRRISETKIIQYAGDMAGGRWVENGDGLAVAEKGLLNNGQHRNVAVICSGATITTNVTVGVTRESRSTNDIGLPRTLSNVLTMDGVENATIIGAMTRLIIGWETTATLAIRPARETSGPRIQERIARDPALGVSAAYVRSVKKHARGILSVSQMGFLHYVLVRHSPTLGETFLTGITTGTENKKGLDQDDPRFVARERLAREVKNLDNTARVEIVFRAWNLWRTGRTPSKIVTNGNIPALVP